MVTPKKSLGQHWLFDSKSLGAIADAATIQPTDTILEIGPGLGPLTIELTQRAHQVVAVELDDQLARELPARVPAHNLRVVHQDILQFDLSQLPAGYKVVANVPYYLTSNLVRSLLESPTPPSVIVMLIQKEVAQRLAATPGDMSILAVSAQFYADISLDVLVPRDKFDPPPQVDSQVVVMHYRGPRYSDVSPQDFMRVVKAGFSEKRKMLRSSLAGGLHRDKSDVEQFLRIANIAPDKRAEALSLDDWHALALAVDHRLHPLIH